MILGSNHPTRTRRLPRLAAACLLALAPVLAGCSDDEPSGDAGASAPASGPGSASAVPMLPPRVAQAVTPEHLDVVCPDGRFAEADEVLATLPPAYAGQAEQLLSYHCDDLIDQIVWAELRDAEAAAALPAEAGSAEVFVAGPTVLVVAERLVDEAGLDVTAYFEALSAACGCGTYDVTGGP